MSSSKGKELFKTYCKSEFSNENIEFYLALDRFIIILNNTNTTTSEFVTLLQEIYNNFISDESPFQVSLRVGQVLYKYFLAWLEITVLRYSKFFVHDFSQNFSFLF